ncbi:MAG: NCS2 family permease [Gemmatimonadota bacterium]|nr:NCS2 family permease [Gemmatimonadota bacterium]MDE2864283.1 NCS2 family permease [Gemmatimonadota bacterium]MXV94306.1 NCS2 family permease [Gemmatimonadota bacterium]MYB06463.1 NCS2 family permease [Gemmatimonadota bacterium]MYE16824.1 NCS2 family permease [Gemmatimonadota bacterium]
MNFFRLQERGTSVRTEVLAGCTTFLTLSYIIFVNPLILSGTGMDSGAVLVATCLAAAFGSLVMGLYANYPIALAPGMGLNAYFAAIAVGTLGLPWQAALGAVFCSGVLMLVLSVLPVREWVVNSIPRSQKVAIAAGIGFFLVIIGLRNAGVIVGSEATLVALGNLAQWPVILAMLGFFGIVAFEQRKVPGAVLICILIVAGVGWLSGQSPAPASLMAAPPSLAPTLLQLDIATALEVGLLAIVFAFLMVDLFDTSGTLVAVLNEAGLTGEDGRVPNLRRALVADSSATIVGSLLGTSTTTSYIESAAGVRAGGRTGLTAVVVAVLFLGAILLAPVATAVPGYATAPAILFVGCVMARAMRNIDWDELTEAVPAIVTAIAMPFTYSIATGIGLGFITYTVVKLVAGRTSELNAAVVTVAVLFGIRFFVM